MKKLGIIGGLVALIVFMLTLSILVRKMEIQEEFEMFQIYTIQGGDFRRTKMNVIVNIENYDIDEMCDKVKEKHDKMNGEADELLIKLYNSREEFKLHKCVGEKEYKKDKGMQ